MTALYWNVDDKGIKWSVLITSKFERCLQREDLINNIVELEQKALNDYKPIRGQLFNIFNSISNYFWKGFSCACGSAY